jgi:hypothetical protein
MPIDPNCFEKVNLFLSSSDLPNCEWTSTTDAFAVLYSRDIKRSDELHKLHTTSVVQDSLEPSWAQPFVIDYYFEYKQHMVIKVFHYKNAGGASTDDESTHVFIGQVEFTMSELMRTHMQKKELALTLGKGQGTMNVRGEPQTDTRDTFCVTFHGNKLKNKDGMFGTSDPHYEVSRCNEDQTYTLVHKSEAIENELNPKFKPIEININQLCGGDYRRPLRIEIFNSKGKAMGTVRTSVHGMLNDPGALIDVDYKEGTCGTWQAMDVSVKKKPTFTQFIAGGVNISVCVAIDFTASNGDSISPTSLHHIDPSGMSRAWNPYQHAITSVCSVIDAYDTDKKYPVYGFGARVRLPGNPQPSAVQHCFPVYGGGLEVDGVMGIMQAYQDSVANVLMSGPTLFQELIESSHKIALNSNCTQENQQYTVMLIITDGVIDDMRETKQALIAACEAPMSTLIIGVGPEDFSQMRELDGDHGKLLEVSGRKATRDICQFVDVNPESQSDPDGWMNLAQKLLAEIPDQMLQFFEEKNIVPNPPN